MLSGAIDGLHGSETLSGSIGRLRKIAVLGARGVGKSALTIRLCEGEFAESYLPTIEDTYQTSLRGRDGELYSCEIIDTAGQDEFSPLGAQATIGVDGYVLLYSVRDANSFELAQYINDKLLATLGSDQVPRVLVGNQIDYSADREVVTADGVACAERIGAAFCECSAKSGVNVAEAFCALLEEIERSESDLPDESIGSVGGGGGGGSSMRYAMSAAAQRSSTGRALGGAQARKNTARGKNGASNGGASGNGNGGGASGRRGGGSELVSRCTIQ